MSSSWTYGADEMTDGDMEAAEVANWTATTATLSSEAGGQAGNCMKLLENGGANPTAHWDWTASSATDFEIEFYVKAGDEASYEVSIYNVTTAANACTIKENEATTSWARQRLFFQATGAAPVDTFRIILRQKCANGAGTYILFDSVVIKPITATTLTFGSAYTIFSTAAYPRNVHTMDATHALVCLGASVSALTISGTAVTGITPVTVPQDGASNYNWESSFIEVSDNLYKSILSYWDSSIYTIRSAIMSWESIPTVQARCGMGGLSDKLRLVSPGSAEYESLRIFAKITEGNHVVNGEFDDWAAGDADNWTDSANAVSDKETVDPYGSSGSSMKLTASGAGVQYTQSDNITVEADKDYWLKLRYKNTASDVAQYLVYDVSNAGDIIAVTDLADSTAWSDEQTAKFTTPVGCTSIYIRIGAKTDGDIVWFDNIYLYTVLAADCVIADPIFNNYAVRIQHPLHGILTTRDASVE
jgi:hypothetical protein